MKKVLQGVVVPAVTPLDDQEHIDIQSLSNLIERLVTHGVDGIFILGTMGEFAAITDSERTVLVENTVKITNGRMKVFCGVGDCGTKRVVENAFQVQKWGIDALVPLLPYYYPQRRPGENRKFLSEFIKGVNKPVVFYENIIMTRRELSYDDFEWVKNQPEIIGLKDSSGDISKFERLTGIFSDRKDFGILTGTGEQALECLMAGGHGIVPGLGSLVPGLCVEIYRAGMEGRWKECKELQDRYVSLTRIYGPKREYWPGAQKTALKFLGIMDDNVASPYFRLNDEERKFVKEILIEEGII